MKRIFTALLSALMLINLSGISASAVSTQEMEETLGSAEIQSYIKEAMDAEHAPAASIAVTNGEEALYTNYGYADASGKIGADNNTVYQIGSVTKAFTALAVLVLEDDGLISVDDSVSEYLPWFAAYYEGKPADIKIKHLLEHSSGIPNSTMNSFEAGVSDDLKEKTARLAEGINLNFAPGTDFEYCNLGYDILGYLIEVVSGGKYEDYVKEKILLPLGMTHSGFNIESENNAKGYACFFGKAEEYDAPKYQGCLADGYLMTTTSDMTLWLNAQLGKGTAPEQLERLIKKSHTIDPDNTAPSANDGTSDFYYSYGWNISADGSYMMHAGLNPNFASQIFVSFENEVGVFAVSNSGGLQASNIGSAVYYDIIGKELPAVSSQCGLIDGIASIGIVIEAVLLILVIILMITQKKRLEKAEKALKKQTIILTVKLAVLIPLTVIAVSAPYLIGYTYSMGWIWMPKTMVLCLIGAVAFLLSLIVLNISGFCRIYKAVKQVRQTKL